MASADFKYGQNCPICLGIYTDPVALRCGHNFCRGCIDRELDTQQESGVYTCPECRKRFHERPGLQRSLCPTAQSSAMSYEDHQASGIFCTYCIHSSVPAVKSCLLCEASLCDSHLKVHSRSPEHVLSEPTTSFGKRKCSTHKKILEYYCSKDSVCICVSCIAFGEHKGHFVEPINAAFEKKRDRLIHFLEKLTVKKRRTEKRVKNLQKRRTDVQEKAACVTRQVNVLFRDIREQLDHLEKRVLSEISNWEEQVSHTVSSLIHQLEMKKDELSRKMSEVEELCQMSDPVTVLQGRGSLRDDFYERQEGDDEDREREDKKVHEAGDLDEGLISAALHAGLADIMMGVKRGIYVSESLDILLDLNTAGNYVMLSGDLKTVSWSDINQCRLETPERFQYCQVLSTRSFSSGRHYWEVETSDSADWMIGVCYPSIDRKGVQSYIGNNNKSWGLCKFNNEYSAIHSSDVSQICHYVSSQSFRIYLDYEAGQLSFYELQGPIRHLHTFSAIFTEPLHAVLYVWGDWVRIKS